jgi:hypothetical protein
MSRKKRTDWPVNLQKKNHRLKIALHMPNLVRNVSCKIDKVESADTGTSPIRERLFNLTDAQRDKVASVANELASEEKST